MKRQAESFTRSLVHRKTDELIPEIMEYAEWQLPEDAIHDAWEDFNDQGIGFEDSPYVDMFIKWYLFLWTPEEAEDPEAEGVYPSPHTIGATFLKTHRRQMDSLSVRVLEAALSDPLSYWQVEAVEARRGVLVKDLLLGRERFVDDISGSQNLEKWDIVLANMQTLDDIHVFNITSPYRLPPNLKTSLQDVFPIDPNTPDAISQLFEYDLDLLMFYQDVIDELFTASMPEIRNMDGKELITTKSVYTLDPNIRDEIVTTLTSTEAFEPLGGKGPSTDKFLWAEAPGKSSALEIVIKGHLDVSQDNLVTECNSTERDHQLRKMLQEVFGKRITHKKTTSEPMDFSTPMDEDRDEMPSPLDLEKLPPETREQLIEQLDNMYLQWADQSILLLEHQTPRQAVESVEGRAKVIDLINDWENQMAHMKGPQFRFNFNRLRDDLGLPRE
jgi:hypothetical protein